MTVVGSQLLSSSHYYPEMEDPRLPTDLHEETRAQLIKNVGNVWFEIFNNLYRISGSDTVVYQIDKLHPSASNSSQETSRGEFKTPSLTRRLNHSDAITTSLWAPYSDGDRVERIQRRYTRDDSVLSFSQLSIYLFREVFLGDYCFKSRPPAPRTAHEFSQEMFQLRTDGATVMHYEEIFEEKASSDFLTAQSTIGVENSATSTSLCGEVCKVLEIAAKIVSEQREANLKQRNVRYIFFSSLLVKVYATLYRKSFLNTLASVIAVASSAFLFVHYAHRYFFEDTARTTLEREINQVFGRFQRERPGILSSSLQDSSIEIAASGAVSALSV